ncbi:MAG: cation transporter [Bacteroidetes bacterium]|nr:cation transporter [Bacteroidota bacterium]MCH8234016.1 cation transporter [Bacteroidota bacterium]
MQTLENINLTLDNRAKTKDRLLHTAFVLSIITILYNLMEGGVSTFYGFQDETLSLFGFGVDSFIEVVSATGIAHMIWRMKRSPVEHADRFEKQALRVTGISFYILTAGLAAGAVMNIYARARPETTIVGIIVSVVSIFTMYYLYRIKLKTGKALQSDPIISDANCTKTCFYLSFILLVSSALYELMHIPYIDALGSMGIAWYAFREGREAFEKSRKGSLVCTDNCHVE